MSTLATAGRPAGKSARPSPPTFWSRGQALWASLATRERTLISATTLLLGLALLWWIGIGPALTTLRHAEAQHRSVDAQLQAMRSMATEAASLQALPRLKPEDSRKALEISITQQLGTSAQLAMTGERATVTLKNTPPDALGRWLSQARSNARAVPTEAHLSLNAARTGWDGSITLALPPS